ncbi:radical SAM protein [uncultured Desulfobacter sp.]|uniref:radical SAM protein n=1 Tax=uncultured Desulfobacter sp. TaxID=240139 RepID=UPI002AA6B78F|nr:radical SAM protein [uncultured Desulfobacter sp.]
MPSTHAPFLESPDLSVPQLHRVMEIFFNTFGISQDRSGAVEIFPATISEQKLALFKEYNVSRISVGVQSFLQTELRTIARGTTTNQITSCLEMVKQLNFPVTNVDLIYGIPGQTPDTLAESLKTALSFDIEQIFLYPLYIRDLTPLKGKSISENALLLYQTGRDILLGNGYVQDSMRMFRKPAPNDLKNSDEYCCQEDGMIGLGTNARSVHYATPYAVGQTQIKQLIESYIKLDQNDFKTAGHGIILSMKERKRRYLIKSILKCRGMKKQDYFKYFGSDCESDFVQIHRLKEKGLLVDCGTHIKLTEKGIMYSDAIGPFFISKAIGRRMASHPAI